jgi:septum formation protein
VTLWLASASPRRKEILTTLGITFSVHVTNVDETERAGEAPAAYVARVARDKRLAAREALSKLEGIAPAILAADTTVAIDDRILGKPASDTEACAMLALLSGRTHFVHTAISIEHGEQMHEAVITTEVVFSALDPQAIARYVASGEAKDKAGAYGIQGMAGGFVARIVGSYTNVVGLPAHETVQGLLAVGALSAWP